MSDKDEIIKILSKTLPSNELEIIFRQADDSEKERIVMFLELYNEETEHEINKLKNLLMDANDMQDFLLRKIQNVFPSSLKAALMPFFVETVLGQKDL